MSVRRWLDQLEAIADRDERRQLQLARTFELVHGRPAADDAEVRRWVDDVTHRPAPTGCEHCRRVNTVGLCSGDIDCPDRWRS